MLATEKSLPFLLTDMQVETSVEIYLRQQWERLDPEAPMAVWFTDADEWGGWKSRSDPVLHIELRKLAKIFLIAPLSANTMAKFANGLCDNLLTCVFRAWDFNSPEMFGSVIVAPAMNTFMY